MIKKGGAAGLLLVLVLVLSCLGSGCAKGSGQSGQSGRSDKTEVKKMEAATEAADAGSVPALDRIRKKGVLRVGTTGDYPPMSYLNPDTYEYEGFDSELAEDLADEYIYQYIEEKDKAA